MKQLVISEARRQELKRELKVLENKIQEASGIHGKEAAEEGGLFKNASTAQIMMDLERWSIRADEILYVLEHAEVVKVNLDSEEPKIEVGDMASIQVTYDGEKPEEMCVQISGEEAPVGIARVTLQSPMAQALLGKEVGDLFYYISSKKTVPSFEGVVLKITKAKGLVHDTKKPYVIK